MCSAMALNQMWYTKAWNQMEQSLDWGRCQLAIPAMVYLRGESYTRSNKNMFKVLTRINGEYRVRAVLASDVWSWVDSWMMAIYSHRPDKSLEIMCEVICIEKDSVSAKIVVHGDAVHKIGQSAALTAGWALLLGPLDLAAYFAGGNYSNSLSHQQPKNVRSFSILSVMMYLIN